MGGLFLQKEQSKEHPKGKVTTCRHSAQSRRRVHRSQPALKRSREQTPAPHSSGAKPQLPLPLQRSVPGARAPRSYPELHPVIAAPPGSVCQQLTPSTENPGGGGPCAGASACLGEPHA